MEQTTDKDIKLHFIVKDKIKDLIRRSKFQLGDSIPTYKELSKKCRVSLVTVQKAMTLLKQEGIIDGRPGQGTILTAYPGEELIGISQVAVTALISTPSEGTNEIAPMGE